MEACCRGIPTALGVTLFILVTATFTHVAEAVEFRMLEEQSPGHLVGNILNSYTSDRNELRFTLMKQGNNAYETLFNVEEISGNLTTKEQIDREIICEFTNDCYVPLEIAVQTPRNDGFFDVVMTKVIIDDINDNSPTFTTSRLDLPIEESAPIGREFTLDGARDKDLSDQFSLQRYVIEPKNPGAILPFNVSFEKYLDGSSSVKLIVNKKLNRETQDSYEFNVIARDGGNPPKTGSLFVSVSVTDINDNYPVFDKPSYNVTVNEETSVGTPILKIRATDEDIGANGRVLFRLSELQQPENLKYFDIDEQTGNLKIKDRLDLVSKRYFKLIVEAVDQGVVPLTTQTFVEVTVLDTSNGAPEIQLNLLTSGDNFARISEYANVGAVVTHVAIVDHDSGRNGDVNCSVDSAKFALSKYDNNEYKVTVFKTLDREIAASHNVTIKCSDNGLPPLTSSASFIVQVDDENDEEPQFRQQRYFVNLDENNSIGDKITTVSAFDLDSAQLNKELEYFVDERSAKYVFVNSVSGDVMANQEFDKESEEGKGFSLTVYAKDKGSPALTGATTVVVTINDVNDNKPVFTESLYRFWLNENRLANTVVGQLSATDVDSGDNAMTRFAMKSSDEYVPFTVMSSGAIKTKRELDREIQAEYQFEVLAINVADATMYTSATVIVLIMDVNDNPPVIDLPRSGNNTVHISHLTPANSVIYRVIAFDRDEANTDNSNLKYSLASVNTTSYFSINKDSGEVVLRAPLQNTNSINKVFLLKLKVSDSGDSAHSVTALLRVVVVTGNGTMATQVEDETNTNFLIVVVVATVTVVISAGIIITICIIRYLDMRRRSDKTHQQVLSANMYAKNNDEVDNIFPLPMEQGYTDRRKKEVSFSLENGTMGEHQHMNKSLEDPVHDSFEHTLLEPPPQYQLCVPTKGKLDDCHSDMSGESAGDSGKGGSDDDLQITNLSFTRDDIQRSKDRWNNTRSNTPSLPPLPPLQSFPTRYSQQNNAHPHQKIVPFSFKKTPTYPGNELTINNFAPETTTSYSVPVYYDDESRSSSGFHSNIDSNSNFHMNNLRHGGKLNLNRGNMTDCVV